MLQECYENLFPTVIYAFIYEIRLKLTLKTPDGRHGHRSSVFTVNFEHD